jgi:hypothetical protein
MPGLRRADLLSLDDMPEYCDDDSKNRQIEQPENDYVGPPFSFSESMTWKT